MVRYLFRLPSQATQTRYGYGYDNKDPHYSVPLSEHLSMPLWAVRCTGGIQATNEPSGPYGWSFYEGDGESRCYDSTWSSSMSLNQPVILPNLKKATVSQ